MDDQQQAIGLAEAARILGLSGRTIRRHVLAGKIPSTRIGGNGKYLIPVSEIRKILKIEEAGK